MTSTSKDPRKVFVVHGRNEMARVAMFQFLRAVGLDPIEWSQGVARTGSGAPYVGEVLDAMFAEAQAVVVLLTGDDVARLRPELLKAQDPDYERESTPQPRPNVLFEAGMAFGREPRRTILVQLGPSRPFSDTFGRHVVHLDNSADKRRALVSRLKTAGCQLADVMDRSDWLNEGKFDESLLPNFVEDPELTTRPTPSRPAVVPAEPVRPSIEVTVAGGQTVMVTVKNQGPAFNLVMQLTYVRATFPLNSTASHKFASRRLNANGTVRFQIMRVTPARELALYADTLRVLQTRDVSYGAPDVEAHLAFVAEDGESPGILSEYSLYVSLPSVTVRTEFAVNLVQLF